MNLLESRVGKSIIYALGGASLLIAACASKPEQSIVYHQYTESYLISEMGQELLTESGRLYTTKKQLHEKYKKTKYELSPLIKPLVQAKNDLIKKLDNPDSEARKLYESNWKLRIL